MREREKKSEEDGESGRVEKRNPKKGKKKEKEKKMTRILIWELRVEEERFEVEEEIMKKRKERGHEELEVR